MKPGLLSKGPKWKIGSKGDPKGPAQGAAGQV